MRHASSLVAGAMAIAAAAIVFEVKGTVRDVEREISKVERAIDEARWRLQTLRADYAFLTRPQRLALQAVQLDMVPGTSREVTTVDGIAHDSQLLFADKMVPVLLSNGQQVQLRFKPPKSGAGWRPAGMADAAARKLGTAIEAPVGSRR